MASSPDWPRSPVAVRRYDRARGTPELFPIDYGVDGRDFSQSRAWQQAALEKKSRRSISDTQPPNLAKLSSYDPPPFGYQLVKCLSENMLTRAGLSDVMKKQASSGGKNCSGLDQTRVGPHSPTLLSLGLFRLSQSDGVTCQGILGYFRHA